MAGRGVWARAEGDRAAVGWEVEGVLVQDNGRKETAGGRGQGAVCEHCAAAAAAAAAVAGLTGDHGQTLQA